MGEVVEKLTGLYVKKGNVFFSASKAVLWAY
jgi:hypothetical protein